MRKWWPRDAKWLQAHPDCGSPHSLKECPPVCYPHPPQKGAPTVMFNNHSKIGVPFTSPPLALSPHLEGPGIITIESETSPQFLYHGTPIPCSDCWRKASRDYPSLSFPSQNLMNTSCSVLPQEIIWQNTTQTSHWLDSAWLATPVYPGSSC